MPRRIRAFSHSLITFSFCFELVCIHCELVDKSGQVCALLLLLLFAAIYSYLPACLLA